MKDLRLIFLAIVWSVIASSASASCIAINPIEDPYGYKSASVVFLGQIVAVQLLTAMPTYNLDASYRLTIEPIEMFKGEAPGPQTFEYKSIYHGQIIDVATGENHDSPRLLMGEVTYEIGDLYFVFLHPDRVLTGGQCSPDLFALTADSYNTIKKLSQ